MATEAIGKSTVRHRAIKKGGRVSLLSRRTWVASPLEIEFSYVNMSGGDYQENCQKYRSRDSWQVYWGRPPLLQENGGLLRRPPLEVAAFHQRSTHDAIVQSDGRTGPSRYNLRMAERR
jgi:hypothetical protein